MRHDPLDRSRDLANRDGEHYEVGPVDRAHGILERLLHTPQRDRLRAVIRVVIGPSNLYCQAASATGKSHAAADQAEADDRNPLKERHAA
jgi:hypothetical protein